MASSAYAGGNIGARGGAINPTKQRINPVNEVEAFAEMNQERVLSLAVYL
jgi:hypothetical protein